MILHEPCLHKLTTVMILGRGTCFMRCGQINDGTPVVQVFSTNIPQEIGYPRDPEKFCPEDVNLDYPDIVIAVEDVKGLDAFIHTLTSLKEYMEGSNENI